MEGGISKHRQTRVAVACNLCRQRKTRCDAQKPVCGNCAKYGEECVYISTNRQHSSHLQLNSMNKRIERLERAFAKFTGSKASQNDESSLQERDSSDDNASNQDIDRIPQPTFNDRLGRMKIYTSGDEPSSTTYISGMVVSVLSPDHINTLSRRLGDPLLGYKFEALSHDLWRSTQTVVARMFESTGEISPNTPLFKKCTEIYCGSSIFLFHPLVPPSTFETNYWQSIPDPLRNGVVAAVIISGALDMRCNSDYRGFSKEFVDIELQKAYYQAIRSLNLMHFSKPSFQLARVSLLLFWLLAVTTAIPSLFHFLEAIVDIAKKIRINRADINSRYPKKEAEWREHVWFLICTIQYTHCTALSLKSLVSEPELVTHNLRLSMSEASYLEHTLELNRIYDRSFKYLFGLNPGISQDSLCEELQNLVATAENWKVHTRREIWETSLPAEPTLNDLLYCYSSFDVQYNYYYILIAIHSIPAFDRDFFPGIFPKSLLKITEAARDLFRVSLSSQRLTRGLSPRGSIGVTTSLFVLLYKQLCYPSDRSSLSDLDYIQKSLHEFRNEIWPARGENNPLMGTWQLLADIMRALSQENMAQAELEFADKLDEILPEYEWHYRDQCPVS